MISPDVWFCRIDFLCMGPVVKFIQVFNSVLSSPSQFSLFTFYTSFLCMFSSSGKHNSLSPLIFSLILQIIPMILFFFFNLPALFYVSGLYFFFFNVYMFGREDSSLGSSVTDVWHGCHAVSAASGTPHGMDRAVSLESEPLPLHAHLEPWKVVSGNKKPVSFFITDLELERISRWCLK